MLRILNEAFAGRFFDVYIFESFAIQYTVVTSSSTRLVDSVNLVFVNHATYYIASQILGIILPLPISAMVCRYCPYVLEVLMAF
jgi:hypothetical protein